jgi:hypothetical protein
MLQMTLSEMFIFDGNSHPSILKIKNNTQHNTLFDFKPEQPELLLTWLEKHWF